MAFAADHCDDTNIRELLKSSNHKQALKNVEKKLKKKPNAVDLLILQAAIQLETHETAKAAKACQDLISQVPVAITADHIVFFYTLTCHLAERGQVLAGVDALWKKITLGASSKAQQVKIAQTWVGLCIQYSQWQHLQKAASLLQTLEPSGTQGHRRHVFLELVAWILSARKSKSDDRKYPLYVELGKRRALAAGSPNKSEWLEVHEWTKTSQEDEVVSTIDSTESTKIYSKAFCRLTDSTQDTPDLSNVELFRKFFCDNIALGVRWEDMVQVLEMVKHEDRTEILAVARQSVDSLKPSGESDPPAQRHWILAESAVLSLEYAFLIKSPQKTSDAASTSLQEFVCSCVRLYGLSRTRTIDTNPKDILPGNEVCDLAATALDRVGSLTPSNNFCAASYLLLRHAVNDWEVVDPQVRLKYLDKAVMLGLFQVSVNAYTSLNVKELLVEPLSGRLFHGLSSWHPYAIKGSTEIFDLFHKALSFYEVSMEKIRNYQKTALQRDNYQSIVDMDQLYEQLAASPARMSLVLEFRRFVRFSGSPPGKEYETLVQASRSHSTLIKDQGIHKVMKSIIPRSLQGQQHTKQLQAMVLLDAAQEHCSNPREVPLDFEQYSEGWSQLQEEANNSNGESSSSFQIDQTVSRELKLLEGLVMALCGCSRIELDPMGAQRATHLDIAYQGLSEALTACSSWKEDLSNDLIQHFPGSLARRHLYSKAQCCIAANTALKEIFGAFKGSHWKKQDGSSRTDFEKKATTLQNTIKDFSTSMPKAVRAYRDELRSDTGKTKFFDSLINSSGQGCLQSKEQPERSAIMASIMEVVGLNQTKQWLSEVLDGTVEGLEGLVNFKLA